MLLPVQSMAAEALPALSPPTPMATTVAPARSEARKPLLAVFLRLKANMDPPWIVSPAAAPRGWKPILVGRKCTDVK
jgi:hypothetical protein